MASLKSTSDDVATTRGDEVVRLTRRDPISPDERQVDMRRHTIHGPGLEDVDAVVNLAGAGIADARWTEARKQEILESRINAARTVVAHLSPDGRCQRLLQGSAIGFYGNTPPGETADEEAPRGDGFLADVVVDWEQAAADAPVSTVFVRTGHVMTPRGGYIGRQPILFKAGLGGRMGDGSQRISWISLDDQIRAQQTLAAYRLMDELRAAQQGLEIESCSSGGGRIDLEVLQRTDRVWTSDVIDPHERQRMLRWTGQLLPPELLGSHIASGQSQTTGRVHDLTFRASTAVFGHLGVEWDLAEASASELVELGAWIAWWKANRVTLLGGELVRVDVPDADAWVHGVVTPERGIFSVGVGSSGPVNHLGDVVLPGLDPEASYDVRPVIPAAPPFLFGLPDWFAGVRLSGRALATVGLRFPVMPPDQVLLVEAVRRE